MIDLKDRKLRDLFVDVDGDYWLVLEHGQWLHFCPNGYARVAFAGPDSYSPHLATAEEIKAFCERFMPVVPAPPGPFEGLTFEWDNERTVLWASSGLAVARLYSRGTWLSVTSATDEPTEHYADDVETARADALTWLRAQGAKL